MIDGVSLTDLNVRWWRSQVGYVAQQPVLFPGTVRENIAAGKPGGATDKEVEEAAAAACAHEFIEAFPDGYETFYSGTSIQMSGGQMQRIGIARAIIRNPAILLLDGKNSSWRSAMMFSAVRCVISPFASSPEATSALDSDSEGQVQRALANIRKVKQVTTVTVAHRLSTIISCDQIAVIADGAIAELGTHTSLFEKNGIYTTLCESQGITASSQGAETRASDTTVVKIGSQEETVEIGVGKAAKGEFLVLVLLLFLLIVQPSTPSHIECYLIDKGGDIEEGGEDLGNAAEDELEEEELAPFSRLLSYNRPEWAYIVTGVLGAAIVGACSPSEAILTARIVGNYYTVDPADMAEENLKWTLLFLALAGASVVGNLMVGVGLSVSGHRLARRMRVMAFTSIVRRNMGWFDFPEHSTGELTTRLAADAEEVANVTGWQLGYTVRMFSSLLTGIIIALNFSWQVGLTAGKCGKKRASSFQHSRFDGQLTLQKLAKTSCLCSFYPGGFCCPSFLSC